MRTREQLKRIAQASYVEYMMGDPFSDDADPSPTDYLSPEEREIYQEVVRELADERAAERG